MIKLIRNPCCRESTPGVRLSEIPNQIVVYFIHIRTNIIINILIVKDLLFPSSVGGEFASRQSVKIHTTRYWFTLCIFTIPIRRTVTILINTGWLMSQV